jgi:SEC-C motif-containing protein
MKIHGVSEPCPCGRSSAKGNVKTQATTLTYGECCALWLESEKPAPDAESLMRSRYSAFCLEREAYLLATWHADFRPGHVAFDPGVKWLGLEVRNHTVVDATHAEVEFVARQKPHGSAAVRLHERSRFVLESGRWCYVEPLKLP